MEYINKDKVFKFLFDLQMSGKTNMFGCGIYVQKRFGLTEKETNPIVLEWMNNYDDIYKRMEIDK